MLIWPQIMLAVRMYPSTGLLSYSRNSGFVGYARKRRKTGDDDDVHSISLPRHLMRIRFTDIAPPLVVYGRYGPWLAHEAVTGVPLTNALRMDRRLLQ